MAGSRVGDRRSRIITLLRTDQCTGQLKTCVSGQRCCGSPPGCILILGQKPHPRRGLPGYTIIVMASHQSGRCRTAKSLGCAHPLLHQHSICDHGLQTIRKYALKKIITTLGSITASELGLILPHEHIFVDLRPPDHPEHGLVWQRSPMARH